MSEPIARDAAARMNLAPVFHHPGHAEALAANLRALAAAVPAEQSAAWETKKVELVAAYGLPAVEQRKPFAFSQGKAVVPVHGLLLNRFSASWGFATGYNFVRSQVQAAAADPDVDTIVLDVNSFGGMAAGCMETADVIHAAREAKPVVAVIDAYAYSAGYALASAATRVVITPSGGCGSIGTVAMHVSLEKALENFGVEVTFIHAGDKKVDGNPYEALSKSAKADIQHQVDELYGQFVAQVSRNRNLDEKAVRNTEAATFTAADAKSLGLVDAVSAPALALENPDREDDPDMSNSKKEGSMPEQKQDGAPAMTDAQIQEKINEGVAAAMAAHNARRSAIKGHEAAKGREALADHLAENTTLTAEAAVAVLQAAPVAKAEEPKKIGANAFKEAMDRGGTPGVGADGGKGGDPAGGDKVDATMALFQAVTGFKAVEPTKH